MTDIVERRAELLPCPFCGGEAELCESATCHDTWLVRCKMCEIKTTTSYHQKEPVTEWNTRAQLSAPADGNKGALDSQLRYVPGIVKNAMLTMWNYICDDTKCHPLDITHGKGKTLYFSPGHWAQFAGDMVAKNIHDLLVPADGKQAGETVEAEYVKKICKALRAGHQYSGIVDELDKKAADLIETLYLVSLAPPPQAAMREALAELRDMIDMADDARFSSEAIGIGFRNRIEIFRAALSAQSAGPSEEK